MNRSTRECKFCKIPFGDYTKNSLFYQISGKSDVEKKKRLETTSFSETGVFRYCCRFNLIDVLICKSCGTLFLTKQKIPSVVFCFLSCQKRKLKVTDKCYFCQYSQVRYLNKVRLVLKYKICCPKFSSRIKTTKFNRQMDSVGTKVGLVRKI